MIRKFFSNKKVFEPHNSVDSIEDLPRDSEDELDQHQFPRPQPRPQPQPQPQPEQPQPYFQPSEVEQEEPAPSTSRTLITIRINPLGRPFSNIYSNIDSPQYDTYSEESKDQEDMTNDRSRSRSNKTEDSKERLRGLRRVEIEPFSVDEPDASESCVVKCFCMRRRR